MSSTASSGAGPTRFRVEDNRLTIDQSQFPFETGAIAASYHGSDVANED